MADILSHRAWVGGGGVQYFSIFGGNKQYEYAGFLMEKVDSSWQGYTINQI